MSETAIPYTPWTEKDYKNALYMKEHEPEVFAVRLSKRTNEIIAETLDFQTIRHFHIGVFPALQECYRNRVALDEIISEYEADQKRKEEECVGNYIKRFTGGLVVGDTVYILQLVAKNKTCPVCLGAKKIEMYIPNPTIDIPQPVEIKCPKCTGKGIISESEYEVVERKVEEIYFSFNLFGNNKIPPFKIGGICLEGSEMSVSLGSIYKTKEEAEEVADKANAIMRKNE